jgi:hypothetical protein
MFPLLHSLLPFIVPFSYISPLRCQQSRVSAQLSVVMCQIIHYKFCCRATHPNKVLPSDKVVRCEILRHFLSSPNRGRGPSSEANMQLKGQLWIIPIPHTTKKPDGQAACQRQSRIETVHVNEVMAGGTCVPDFERVKFQQCHFHAGNAKREL